VVSKYADHLPLYRQSQILARQGVRIERSTLAQWVTAGPHPPHRRVDAMGLRQARLTPCRGGAVRPLTEDLNFAPESR
jgi:transposase